MKIAISFVAWSVLFCVAPLTAQDATVLEEQYKTCSKHYIPADKCTMEVYNQLKAKDNAPLDPDTATALKAVKEYQKKLKNPASIQINTAYITSKGSVCLDVSAQNTLGGQTRSRVVLMKGGHWFDESGFFGKNDQWPGLCTGTLHTNKLVPGLDVTEKVSQALKDGK